MEIKETKQSLKAIVADDNFFIRKACKDILKSAIEKTLIEEAKDPEEIFSLLNQEKCNLLIINIELIDGVEEFRVFVTNYPDTKIILILNRHLQIDYKVIFKISPVGIITPNTSEAEIIAAINAVLGGSRYIASELQNEVFDQMTNTKVEEALGSLTDRELEVAHLIKMGLRSIEIAEKLDISDKTVEAHRRKIYKKLKVNNVVSLIAFFKSNGIY